MNRLMISLDEAKAAIKSVIDYYSRDIRDIRERTAQRQPDEESEAAEDALLIAAKLCKEGAERAIDALATVRTFEAVDFGGERLYDLEFIPDEFTNEETEHAIDTLLHTVGRTAADCGMISVKTDETPENPTHRRVRIRFTMIRPNEQIRLEE